MKALIKVTRMIVAAFTLLAVNADQNNYPITKSDKVFFRQIQTAVANSDFKWLSTAVSYPLDVQLTNIALHLSNEVDFQKNARIIITEHLKSLVKQQPIDSLFKNWEGVMVGNGQLWFSPVGETRKDGSITWVYKITAFNLEAPDVTSSK